jgi:hypothetical protein
VDKIGRKQVLKKLVSQAGPVTDEIPNAFVGETTVATRNTVYRFYDGVCFSAQRLSAKLRGGQATGEGGGEGDEGKPPSQEFIGMRLLGWFDERAVEISLSAEWKLGTCAVLRRPSAAMRDSIAITSATTSFRTSNVRRPPKRASGNLPRGAGSRPKLGVVRPITSSMTRINLPPAPLPRLKPKTDRSEDLGKTGSYRSR